MRSFNHTACALSILVASTFAQTLTWPVGKSVNTTSGIVHGHAASNATFVSEYLGIPYARPPINELRFAPPEQLAGSANISGTNFGSSCPQVAQAIPSGLNLSIPERAVLKTLFGVSEDLSEDCLYLNIWTKPQSGSISKPVMVWIHGGGFTTGGSSLPIYNGQYWAEDEDVVLVSINYRLDVFGFSGAPGLPQNVGLLDQRMAVEWVRDNIAGFGGDPQRMTIFGESSGGGSVDYYTYIWLDEPIISGAIMESGAAFGATARTTAKATADWYEIAQTLGCGNNSTQSTDEILDCMRDSSRVPQDKLLEAANAAPSSGPVADEKTVFSDYGTRTKEGKIMRVPALVGSNGNEGATLQFVLELANITFTGAEAANNTLLSYTCPSNLQGWLRWGQRIPVWRYRYFPSFPNIDIRNSIGRAYHSAEIAPLFGTAQDVVKIASTEGEERVGNYLRHAWATFAREPARGLQDVLGWSQYSPDANGTKGLVLLGKEGGPIAQCSTRGMYDSGCPPRFGFA